MENGVGEMLYIWAFLYFFFQTQQIYLDKKKDRDYTLMAFLLFLRVQTTTSLLGSLEKKRSSQ